MRQLIFALTILATGLPVYAVTVAPVTAFDVVHPPCDGEIDLEVKQDYFVPIANPLPGREEFNNLVRYYQAEQWNVFDKEYANFAEKFKTSPLAEAGAFLSAQTKMDRANKSETQRRKDAEFAFREVILQFPKSTLEPVLSAGFAHFFLRVKDYQKALRVYEDARKKFSDHSLACVFDLGAGEAAFQLRDFTNAEAHLKEVSNKCRNRRVSFAARMRLADIARINDKPEAESLYAAIANESSSFSGKFYQSLLYNLGEIKFNAKQLPEAKFYIDEYLKNDSKNDSCMPYALKRSGDIALRKDGDWQKAAGLYLAVHQKAPNTDIGRFAHVRALLLGMEAVGKPELARRAKVIDEEIKKIDDPQLLSLAKLERQLALLEQGDLAAVTSLMRLKAESPYPFMEGAIGDRVKVKTYQILTEESEKWNAQGGPEEKIEAKVFAPLEQGFEVWWKNAPEAQKAIEFYRTRVVHRFAQHLKRSDIKRGIALLTRWHQSPLWPKEGPTWEERNQVGEALVSSLMQSDSHSGKTSGDYRTKLSISFVENENVIKSFLSPEYDTLWLKVALITQAQEKLKYALSTAQRAPASVSFDSKLSDKTRQYFWLVTAQALAELGKTKEAEHAFNQVSAKELSEEAWQSRFSFYRATKSYDKAFRAGQSLFEHLTEKERINFMGEMYTVSLEGKLWSEAATLLDMAKKAKLVGRKLVDFYFMDAKAKFEAKDCKRAVESLEVGLKEADPTKPYSAEKFQLGKCLVELRRPNQARKVLAEVVKAKDPTWSSLAESEMHLIQ